MAMELGEGDLSIDADGILQLLQSGDVRQSACAVGVVGDLEALERVFSEVRFALMYANSESQTLKVFLEKLQSVFLDADDLLDGFVSTRRVGNAVSVLALSEKVRAFFSTTANPLVVRHKLRKEIHSIRQAAAQALSDYMRFPENSGFDFGGDIQRRTQAITDHQVSHSFVDESEVVGRFLDRDKIVSELDQHIWNKRLAVIPIVGVKGIGKTTLAQLVFNHSYVSQRFCLKIWVSVSGLLDLKLIAQTIIASAQLGRSPRVYHQMDELQKELRREIEWKSFLLVLDDVRDESRENWLSLKNLLMGCKDGGAVLVTSRSTKVAKIVGTVQPLYLDWLSEEESWVLFKRRVGFDERQEEEELEFEKIGRSIAANCTGVPLVLCHVASLLYSREPDQWQSFVNKEKFLEALKESGFQFEANGDQQTKVMTGERKQSHSFVPQGYVIGRDIEKNKIIECIICEESESKETLRVIPIVGDRGIGKTALAQLVFNDEIVSSHFYWKIWVSVSGVLDLRLIGEGVIESIESQRNRPRNYLQMDKLQTDLRSLIRGKRFLLVLDDVRDESRENWLSLKNLLMGCQYGSAVLVTTRSKKVAKIVGTVQPYSVDRLTEEESWDLLINMVDFDNNIGVQEDKKMFEEIGIFLSKKCKGVPLVIRHIASTLYVTDFTEWLSFVDKKKFAKAVKELEFQPEGTDDQETKAVTKQSHSFVPREAVIGRDFKKDEIIDLILKRKAAMIEQRLVVIPIVGNIGIGKTALAQLVFNDEIVLNHFDLMIWISVSGLLDLRLIIRGIIESAKSRAPSREYLQMDRWQKKLQKIISRRRFFLVLDDVQDESRENWLDLENLLVGCIYGSVLVTTRSEKVAKIMCTVQPYPLDPLREEDSWILFNNMVDFNSITVPDYREFANIGRLVAAKCKGVPLVIRHIASALYVRNFPEWWSFVDGQKFDEAVQELTVQDDGQVTKIAAEERKQSHSFVHEKHVIGRNLEKYGVKKLIFAAESKTKEKLKVVPIIGIQGIGKTTLAQLVFNDVDVSEHFEVRIWISISGLLDLRLIIYSIIESTKKRNYPHDYLQLDQCQNALQEIIYQKKFFIVLDDVRDDSRENWLSLKSLLIGGGEGSTVLVTTRDEKAAKIMRTGQTYSLENLSEEDAWLLFKSRVNFNQDHQELEGIGRSMVAKCKGVPLVICHVASALYHSRNFNEWQSFVDEQKFDEAVKESGFQFEVNNGQETRVTTRERRQSHSFVAQEEIIGRDKEKEKIIATLLGRSYEEDVVAIPIVGIGGLGKTALAQLIYNDKKVQDYFELKIWVCVTDVFDLRAIVEKIVTFVTAEDPRGSEMEHLVRLFRQEILGKLYFLVLDDVWNENLEEWLKLKNLLSVGAPGSRIIVTTRSKVVATITGEKQTYNLGTLDVDKSWCLFMKMAFEQGQEPSKSQVIRVGKEIVKSCGGIPLVLRTVGSILYLKDPETEWLPFYEKELLKIMENEGDILASLKLSYDHLPQYLKRCFSYCGLFPKDYEIDVQMLVNLWISHGYVEKNLDICLEDVGYDYFMDLLRRSFFQETKSDELGNVTRCKMQNSISDLARLVARNACATLGLKGEIIGVKPRHISFDFHFDSAWQLPVSIAQAKRIRTLMLPRQSRWEVEGRSDESVCDAITKFKFLRMLDLHNSGIKVVPSSIGKLKHLRYLDLSQNVNLQALPNSITRLQNLQTLKLNHCSNLRALSGDISKLVNLRNLENDSCYSLSHMPRGLSQLSNLRTVSEFVLSKGTGSSSKVSGKLDELKELNYLSGRLKVKNLRCRDADRTAQASLNEKQNLRSLTLVWDIEASIVATDYERSLEDLKPQPNLRELCLTAYGGIKFSSWLPGLTNLAKLVLSKCTACQCLPPLDGLPSLQVLIVDELTGLRCIVKEEVLTSGSTPFFQSLKELRFSNLPMLTQWWEDSNHVECQRFPCLSKLVIEDCPVLTSMPLFPSLDELLVLKNTRWEPFQQTITFSEASSSTSSMVSLSKLKTLRIINMSNFDAKILNSLLSLRALTLDHLSEIKTLLEGLQRVTSLQELHIWRCSSLEGISGWISGIKSLRTLSLRLCPNLTIPADQISLITSLPRVEIENCPHVSHIESMLKDRLYRR